MQPLKYIIDLETYNRDQINSKTIDLKDDRKYTILNYKMNEPIDEESGKYRSVILNESGKVVCFAPPKSIDIGEFQNKYSIETDFLLINEVVEGTMINLFYDNEKSLWEIATKASIGGNYWYFRNQYSISEETMSNPQLTFRQMFLNGLGMSESDNLQNSTVLKNLDKNYCYSFIIQHPMNHIVNTIIAPTIYLVAVYEINQTDEPKKPIVRVVDPLEYENWPNMIQSPIRFPRRITELTYEEISSKKCSVDSTYDIPGVMFFNTATGERACMENEAYKIVRELRGNNPNLHFQYLSLKNTNKITDFLIHFDQYTDLFGKFERQYQDFIKQVHNGYVSYYVKKEGNSVSKQYFPLVYKIHHEVFIPSVESGSKIIIKREVIADYINKLDPKSLIFYLNWKDKEKAKDKKTNGDKETDVDKPIDESNDV